MLFTADHDEPRRALQKFIAAEINPHVDEWEDNDIFPAHELFKKLGNLGFLGLNKNPDDWGWDWSSQVEKDLRRVLGRPERGPYSRIYCGGPKPRTARAKCRAILLTTLRQAVGEVAKAQGSPDPANWKVPSTCEQKDPPICDQFVPTTLGAVDTPPFPWQNRGTYHQVVELTGHR